MNKKNKSTHRKSTAKKKQENKKNKLKLKDNTKSNIWGIGLLLLGILVLLSIFKLAGLAGDFIYLSLNSLFGFSYFLLPIILLIIGVSFIRHGEVKIALRHNVTGFISLLSALGIADITTNGAGPTSNLAWGGYLGSFTAWPFVKLFGVYASVLILSAILIISLIILLDQSPSLTNFWKKVWSFLTINLSIPFLKKKNKNEEFEEEEEEEENDEKEEEEEFSDGIKGVNPDDYEEGNIKEKNIVLTPRKKFHTDYINPPLSLLEKDKGRPNVGDLKGNMNIIQRTLLNFGISVEMDEVTIGPTITRYALKPAQGVKLSRIVGLQNDLALALAAHPIRIEAPIPGKSLVGIEIPNKSKSTVGLATLLSDSKFQNSPYPLT